MAHILIVEDEPPISNLIHISLTNAGYHCQCAFDGATAADLIQDNVYDLILLDVMLPEIDGYELMEFIGPMKTPVIFITAKNSLADRVRGLHMGGDDYIVKPFEIVELVARVEAVLRRYNKSDRILQIGDVEINTESYTVTQNGRAIELTLKEFELLVLLVRNRNTALFRETIFQRIWKTDYIGETRTLDLHIQRLRRKLGWQDKIKTVYKVGYRLEIPS